LKAYPASPPDMLRVDEKHVREYAIVNCCGVVITTNHLQDGIYLPADDRRHYVAWSKIEKEDARFHGGYWSDSWAWYGGGRPRHVTAWLLSRNIRGFDAKAPPKKTATFRTIVDSNRSPE
jgi:hypothetical protein